MFEFIEFFVFLVCLQFNGLIIFMYNNFGFNDIDFVIKVIYMVWVDEQYRFQWICSVVYFIIFDIDIFMFL